MSTEPVAPAEPKRSRAAVAAAVVGWTAVALMLGAILVSLVPIENPGIQSCGAPIMFLVRGRPNAYPDQNDHMLRDGRVVTLTKAELARAYDHSCSKRVSARMVPAGIVFVIATTIAVLLLICSMVFWWRRDSPRSRAGEPDLPVSSPS